MQELVIEFWPTILGITATTAYVLAATLAVSILYRRKRTLEVELRAKRESIVQYEQRLNIQKKEIECRDSQIVALTSLLHAEADQETLYSRTELIDEKTKLPNEKRGMIEIRRLCKLVANGGEEAFCMIYFDLEGFKQINKQGMSWRGGYCNQAFCQAALRTHAEG